MERNIYNAPLWQRVLYSRWFFAALLIVTLLVMLAYGRLLYRDYQVRREIERLQDEVTTLEANKLKTLEILKYVQSPAFVEEKARLELNLSRAGERMAVFSGTSTAPSRQALEPVVENESRELSNPAKWWYYFVDPNLIKELRLKR